MRLEMTALQQLYRKWNRHSLKLLWLLTAIGLIASLPLLLNRIEAESSSNNVEMVFDYRDLLEISEYKTEPITFVNEQTAKLREAGISAMAVYESTLRELELSGSVKLYSAEDAALLSGDPEVQLSNRTYVLFADEATATELEPLIREGFALFEIGIEDWQFKGKRGLSIEEATLTAELLPLDPDPRQIRKLHEMGYRISARISDTRPYDHHRMDALFGRLKQAGVDTIIFSGKEVTGYSEDKNQLALTSMAELLNKHGLRFAVIELPLDKQQKGIGKLAFLSDFETVRLHSILEEEAFTDAPVLADRYVLAVKDRNFRMLYLNARVKVDKEKGTVTDPLHNLVISLKDPDFGAIKRIEAMGFKIGPPQPFEQVNPAWEKLLKAFVILGAVALIARMIGYFLPRATLFFFIAGLVGTAGLYVLNPTICAQALALLAAVSAPTAAVITAVHVVQRKLENGFLRSGAAFGFSLGLFVRTVLLSLVGAVYVVALLNHITYLLVLNQFRGVSVLHTLPMALVALYLMFFFGTSSYGQAIERIRKFLLANIQIIWVVATAFAGVVFFYYLTRTGNQSTVLPIDRAFRALLENTFGIRPRTKELITHPLFIMGIFLLLRYGKNAALALITIGSMAMLSVVDTFAHLHTPLWISSLRVLYGALISVGIALVYYAAWELLVRGWRRWRKVLLPQE